MINYFELKAQMIVIISRWLTHSRIMPGALTVRDREFGLTARPGRETLN